MHLYDIAQNKTDEDENVLHSSVLIVMGDIHIT